MSSLIMSDQIISSPQPLRNTLRFTSTAYVSQVARIKIIDRKKFPDF